MNFVSGKLYGQFVMFRGFVHLPLLFKGDCQIIMGLIRMGTDF